MKNKLAYFIAFTAFLFIFGNAKVFASDDILGFMFKPYIGVDYNKFDGKNLSDSNTFLNSIKRFDNTSLNFGVRVHKNLGMEMGFANFTQAIKNKVSGDDKIRLKTIHFNVIGYLPLVDILDSRLELFAGTGINDIKSDANLKDDNGKYQNTSSSSLAPKILVGVQVAAFDSISVRLMGEFARSNVKEIDGDSKIYSLGLAYYF